jgi:tocopherol cyclase
MKTIKATCSRSSSSQKEREDYTMGKWKQIHNPEMFQGNLRSKHYFEGWYFKLVDSTQRHIYAVIPGVSLDKKERTSHAFIQLLDGTTARMNYFSFPLEQFWASNEKFEIKIGENCFSQRRIHLDINQEGRKLLGDLEFRNVVPWPKKPLAPGIMGWFSYVPFMETYHGIVSMNHEIQGTLQVDGRPIVFDKGKGYIEKDWGASFPSSWIWLQSNHFKDPQLSLMVSIAKVPFVKSHFMGFVVALWYHGKTYGFATYTGAKIRELKIKPNSVRTAIEDRLYRMEIEARKSKSGVLMAPASGIMKGHDRESITSSVRLVLRRIDQPSGKSTAVIDDLGENTGLEIMDRNELKIS